MRVVRQYYAAERVGKRIRSCAVYHPRSNLSCSKSVAWILTSDWIILHGNHAKHVTCRKRLPRAGKTRNLYRFCCKAVELLATQYFRNLRQRDLLQDVQVYFVCGKTRSTAIELVSQQLTLQIKLHISSSPFHRTFTNLIFVNQIKITRSTRGVRNLTVYSKWSKFICLKIEF